MAVFDDAWWDARMVNDRGEIDLTSADFGSAVGAWVRWRLVDDLMSRFYVDYGLEGIFGGWGEAPLYQVRLASPTCERESRYFGRICANGPHVATPGAEPSLDVAGLQPYRVQPPTEGDVPSHAQVWQTYGDYLTAVTRDLRLADASVVGHEKCFHRRGRSSAQLAFRLAVLLRTSNGAGVAPDDALVTVTPAHEPFLRDVAPWFREPVPVGAPRWLLVTTGSTRELPADDGEAQVEPLADAWIITNDGSIHHSGGVVNAREMWRAGASEDGIIAELIGIEAE